jgi:hypothetical protein
MKKSTVRKMLRKLVGIPPTAEEPKEKKKVTDYFSANYNTLHHCTVHVPIEGRLEILFDPMNPNRRVGVPVQSVFLVTCTRDVFGDYRLTWSCSLS